MRDTAIFVSNHKMCLHSSEEIISGIRKMAEFLGAKKIRQVPIPHKNGVEVAFIDCTKLDDVQWEGSEIEFPKLSSVERRLISA